MNMLKIDISNINIDNLETQLINNYNKYEIKKIDYYILENYENLSLETLSLYMSQLKNILGGWNKNTNKKRKYLLVKNINNLKYMSDLCINYNYDLLYDGESNLSLYDLKELCTYPCTLLIENSEKSLIIRQLLVEEFDKLSNRVKILTFIPENNNYYLKDNYLNKYDFQDNCLNYYDINGELIAEIKTKNFSSSLNKIDYQNYEKLGNYWFLYKSKNYEAKIVNGNSKYVGARIRAKENGKRDIKELYNLVKELKKIIEFVGEYKTNIL